MAQRTNKTSADRAEHLTAAAPPRSSRVTIEQSRPGERMDTRLRELFPVVSRGAIQRLIEQGCIRVNGLPPKATQTPRAGDIVEITWPEARPASTRPEAIPLAILFEDKDILVVNKPPGIVVHPSAGHEAHTLVNALLHHCQGQLSGIGGVARPGIVHRLDRDTSGCIAIAKNDFAHQRLAEQFAGRQTEKTYLAIVCGEVASDRGDIHASIARHPTHRKRMMVTTSGGREARSSYRVRYRLKGSALLEVAIHTGRTHQIRVHFQHLGHPVFGDEVYGKRQTARLAERSGFTPPRLMLHAWRLAFTHPRSKRPVALKAPMPFDFAHALSRLTI